MPVVLLCRGAIIAVLAFVFYVVVLRVPEDQSVKEPAGGRGHLFIDGPAAFNDCVVADTHRAGLCLSPRSTAAC